MNHLYKYVILTLLSLSMLSCGSDTATKKATTKKPDARQLKIPIFSQDSAFHFVEKQLAFGPRVPGFDSHVACKDWFVKKLKEYGATVIEQDFTANFYTGESAPATNVIAAFNPKASKRIILAAHWDSRMFGENDEDESMRDKPIPGADDGASGVAVLLEIARLINLNPIEMGVDIIFFDAEDQGKRGEDAPNTYWCLGSQHWSRNFHVKNYKPNYGILLDMVGAKNPRFGQDEASLFYAGTQMNKYWSLAQSMGYGDMFVSQPTGGIIDDHYFVNTIAKIPMFDIINQPLGEKFNFQKCWHKHCDDITNINKRSLRVVGQVVTAGIYRESIGNL